MKKLSEILRDLPDWLKRTDGLSICGVSMLRMAGLTIAAEKLEARLEAAEGLAQSVTKHIIASEASVKKKPMSTQMKKALELYYAEKLTGVQ